MRKYDMKALTHALEKKKKLGDVTHIFQVETQGFKSKYVDMSGKDYYKFCMELPLVRLLQYEAVTGVFFQFEI